MVTVLIIAVIAALAARACGLILPSPPRSYRVLGPSSLAKILLCLAILAVGAVVIVNLPPGNYDFSFEYLSYLVEGRDTTENDIGVMMGLALMALLVAGGLEELGGILDDVGSFFILILITGITAVLFRHFLNFVSANALGRRTTVFEYGMAVLLVFALFVTWAFWTHRGLRQARDRHR
jgi:hypothetical protein